MSGSIVVDWGTTHLRAWRLAADGAVVEHRNSDRGMGKLAGEPTAFARAYDALCEGWPDLPGLACGMVGARQGWVEAPYVPVPARLDGLMAHAVAATSDGGRRLQILPGLSQAEPSDVMRGEETKLLGLALTAPAATRDTAVLLPGTHAKHVTLADGTVSRFTTVPIGEVFDVLGQHSILRLSVAGADGDDAAAFAAAVRQGAALSAGGLIAALFELRAASLLAGAGATETRSRLLGLLIGAELGLLPPDRPVVLVASGALTEPYRLGFAALGRPAPVVVDGADLVLRALTHLTRELAR